MYHKAASEWDLFMENFDENYAYLENICQKLVSQNFRIANNFKISKSLMDKKSGLKTDDVEYYNINGKLHPKRSYYNYSLGCMDRTKEQTLREPFEHDQHVMVGGREVATINMDRRYFHPALNKERRLLDNKTSKRREQERKPRSKIMPRRLAKPKARV